MARIDRTKNTITGAVWGIIERIASIVLPFIVRTVLIKKLGSEYLGLSGLFYSVLQVLNLTELGFGAAAIFAMYRPIAEDDYATVGAILQYLKKIYRWIGGCILGIGVLIIPFLRNFISGDLPVEINIYILYLIYLGNAVLSYWLFAYKTSLLLALQLNKITSKIGFWVSLFLHLAQIGVLLIIKSYYVYVSLILVSTIAGNLIRSYIVDKNYSVWLVKADLDQKTRELIRSRIFPLMSTKLATVLLNSTDTLVISAFLGLQDVAIYNNYYYIMTSISGFLFVMYAAMQAGIGNALVVDSHEKINADFRKFSFINNWIVTVCTICLLCLYQPFMDIWVGQEMMLSYDMVILFCLYFYSLTALKIVVIYKDAAGIWKEDMFRTYLSCFINLILNIILVRYIGLYGVIGSSVFVSLLIDPWIAKTLYRKVLQENPKYFYGQYIKTMIIIILLGGMCLLITTKLPDGYFGFALKGIVCLVLPNIILWGLNKDTKQYQIAISWALSKIKK